MRSPRWRKVWRDVWLHKARTVLVVLAISVGILGAGSVLNSWAMLRTVTHDGYLSTNPASATFRVDSVDDALLARVRAVRGVAMAEARHTVIARATIAGAEHTAVLFAIDARRPPGIGALQTIAGSWPPHPGTIAIERSSTEFAGAELNQPAIVTVGDAQGVSLPISGITRDAGLAPGWMEHLIYGFIDRRTLPALGVPDTFDQLLVTVTDRSLSRAAVRRLAYDIKRAIEASGHRVSNVEVPEPGRHIHAGQIDSLLMTKGAFGFAALLLSGFLVVNLVSAMLTGQVREIGVMKTLGATTPQLAAMYLVLAAGLGLLACVLAIPAAAFTGRAYAEFVASALNFDSSGFTIPWWSIALQVAVGVVMPVLAAAVPVWHGCHVSVGNALRDTGISAERASTGALFPRLSGVARPLLLSLRNTFRKRQRTLLTLVTLALGGAVYLGALNLRVSIRDSVAYMFGDLIRFDVTMSVAEPQSIARLEGVAARVPGVTVAEAWTVVRAQAMEDDGTLGDGFQLSGVAPATRLLALPLVAGRWLVPSDSDAIVVSKRLVDDDPAFALGRRVKLMVRGHQLAWTVAGVVNSGVTTGAYVARAALVRAPGDSGVETALVRVESRDGARQADVARELRAAFTDAGMPVARAQVMAENRSAVEDHLLLVAGTLVVMSLLGIVVGGLGLASTMSLAVLERTREIGVLRAMGAQHRHIHVMVQVEGLTIALLGWALAIPLSLPISVGVATAFARIMMPVPTTWMPEWSGVLIWLGIVVGVGALACAWPAWRATKTSVREALNYE